MTACGYCFSLVEYIAIKKELKLWEKIEIQIVYPYIYYLCSRRYIFNKHQQQNKWQTRQKRRRQKMRKTEGKKKGYSAGFEPGTLSKIIRAQG